MEKFKTCLYLRLSKEDEKIGESESIINQKNMLIDFVSNKEDLEIIEIMIDDGYSGSNFERPAFKEMLELIKGRKINCVVVKDFSRFGRDFTEVGRYLEDIFPFMGVRFISVNDNYDSFKSENGTENLIIPFKNLINDSYLRDISLKIRSSLDAKRKKGDFIGSFPTYGYLKDKNDKTKLVVDEVASKVVQDIFKYRIEGLSCDRIAKKLNDEGILCPLEYKRALGMKISTSFRKREKALWVAKSIFRILKNPVYIGTLEQKKKTTPNHKVKKTVYVPKDERIIVKNNHEPIISKEVFECVQRLMEIDTRIAPNQDKVYLFSGIIKCGECGANLVRKNNGTKEKPYMYYICNNLKNKKGCKNSLLRVETLEEIVFEAVKNQINLVLDLEDVEHLLDSTYYFKREYEKIKNQIEEAEKELEKYDFLKLNLYEDLKNGILKEDEYKNYYASYSEKLTETKKIIEKFNDDLSELSKGTTPKQVWTEYFKRYKNIKCLTRELVVTLIEDITVYKNRTIKIHFKYQDEYNTLKKYAEDLEVV